MSVRNYESVSGFFVQDKPDESSTDILPRFGLIDESPERWKTFVEQIGTLNETAPQGVQYKVFFLGRHGEGFHNVGEAKYGTEEWVKSWAKLNGDGEIVWGPDPRLTELGEEQAKSARSAWEAEKSFGIPLPGKLYTSPLTRAIRTNQLTFDDSIISDLKTTIVENIREYNGVHTADKRRKRSEIHADFPEYLFEDGFTEDDLLWKDDRRETPDEVNNRAKSVLDMIFDYDAGLFISITAHGGFNGGFLQVCNHSPWNLPTGGVIPVLVMGSKIEARN